MEEIALKAVEVVSILASVFMAYKFGYRRGTCKVLRDWNNWMEGFLKQRKG